MPTGPTREIAILIRPWAELSILQNGRAVRKPIRIETRSDGRVRALSGQARREIACAPNMGYYETAQSLYIRISRATRGLERANEKERQVLK